jgi:cold shock protein
MPVGTVKWFNEAKGFGFIEPDEGGDDAFVHITAVERSGMRTLRENQRVSYDLQQERPGKMSATNLRSAEEGEQLQQAEVDAPQSDEPQNTVE